MHVRNFVVLVVVFVLLNGCSSRSITENESLKHKQIRIVDMERMLHDLNNVIISQHKSEFERDDDRKRYAISFANTLKLASKKTISFPKNDATFSIQSSKIEEYNKLSQSLYTQGEKIENLANEYNFKALDISIEDIKKTCIRCHTIVGLKFNPLQEKRLK